MKYLKYFKYLFIHKWFVFLECCNLGIPWLGIIHDWSKFKLNELIPYAKHFYGSDKIATKFNGDALFDLAWLLHQKRNKHHWQWWLLHEDDGGTKIIEMPLRYPQRNALRLAWSG